MIAVTVSGRPLMSAFGQDGASFRHGGRPDFANAPPSAPSCRFNKEGIAQSFGMMESVGQGFSRTSAPGHDRNLRLLRKLLRGDLVADAAHSLTVWAYERDPHFAA